MTESDLYVKIEHGLASGSSWRWKITVYKRSKSSSYSDKEINQFRSDFCWGRTVVNWKAKRMLRKARERHAFTATEWVIE